MERTIEYPKIAEVQKKVKAFLLMEAESEKKSNVVQILNRLPGVVSVDTVSGVYDIIATIEGNSLDEIGNLVVTRMQPITEICRCVVCLVSPLKEFTG